MIHFILSQNIKLYLCRHLIEEPLGSLQIIEPVACTFLLLIAPFYSDFVDVILFQCLSLLLWLEERYENVYTCHPGFQKGSKPLLALDNPFPMELPENLFGEKWAFVQLPYSGTRAAKVKLHVIYLKHPIEVKDLGFNILNFGSFFVWIHSFLC